MWDFTSFPAMEQNLICTQTGDFDPFVGGHSESDHGKDPSFSEGEGRVAGSGWVFLLPFLPMLILGIMDAILLEYQVTIEWASSQIIMKPRRNRRRWCKSSTIHSR